MCDDQTEQDNARWLALTRRDFGRAGAAAALLAALPACAEGDDKSVPGMATAARAVTIPTPDGTADAFFVHPAEGPHPAVIMWPDLIGLRDAYKTMGTRLAAAGFAVLVVNQYYRSAPAPFPVTMASWNTPAGQATLGPMLDRIDSPGIARDAAAFVAWLDRQPQVDTARRIGTTGYCMTGPNTLRTAAAAPARVGAACSFHGGGLVDDTPDSPHLLIAQTQAAMLIAIAANDDERQPEVKTVLRKAADAAKRKAEIEVYPARHGWCTIDAPAYDHAQAERAWGRLLATLRENL